MNKVKDRFLFYALFFFISLIPLLLNFNLKFKYNGQVDYLSPISIHANFFRSLFVYDPFYIGGIDRTPMMAEIFPFNTIFLLLDQIKIPSSLISYIFLSSLIFIASSSLFFYLEYLTSKVYKIKSNYYLTITAFCIALLYGFSPFFASQIISGHFTLILVYITFPFVLYNLDCIISDNFATKRYLILFILFLLQASSFINIAIFIVEALLIFSYIVISYFIRNKLLISIKKILLIFFLMFASNAWWIIAFIANLKKIYMINVASDVISKSIDYASTKSQISNIFLGRADYFTFTNVGLSQYYLSDISVFFHSVLILFFIYSFIFKKRDKFLIVFLFLLVISIFMLKGPNEPGGSFFMWLYEHFPGFHIFRRPISKFYWPFVLFYLLIIFVGVIRLNSMLIRRKTLSLILCIFFLSIAISSVYVFCKNAKISNFNIPNYYVRAKDYLLKDNVNNLLVLPNLDGMAADYDENVNLHSGTDFIYSLLDIGLLIPDTTNYTAELPIKKITNNINSKIINSEDFCSLSKKVGLTHILIHNDTILNKEKKLEKNKIVNNLLRSKNIVEIRDFLNESSKTGITIFSISKLCRNNSLEIITPDVKYNYSYQLYNPVSYMVKISNIHNDLKIRLHSNFDSGWQIFQVDSDIFRDIDSKFQNSNTYSGNYKSIYPLTLSQFVNSSITNNFFDKNNGNLNNWDIKINKLDKKMLSVNEDGTFNVSFLIYYQRQNFFYYGLIFFIMLLIYLIYSHIKHK